MSDRFRLHPTPAQPIRPASFRGRRTSLGSRRRPSWTGRPPGRRPDGLWEPRWEAPSAAAVPMSLPSQARIRPGSLLHWGHLIRGKILEMQQPKRRVEM